MNRRSYSPLLALAGFSVAFIFMLFAAVMIYASAAFIMKGGFWYSLAGLALLPPFGWSVYLGCGVLNRTVVNQP